MRRALPTLAVIVLVLSAFSVDPSAAGKGGGSKGSGGGTAGQVTVTPSVVSSPVKPSDPLTVCVSGFSEGNFVNINVPMTGNPQVHSSIGFSDYVGSSGGFCVSAPPSWTNLTLAPGTYTIQVYWASSGSGSRLRSGPSTTFTVTGS